MTLSALALSLALNASAAPAPAAAPATATAAACVPQKPPKKTALTYPDGTTILVDIVDTPESREIGLMCRTKLPRNYGMLFVFPQDMNLNFWMKNTLVSLDIVWIGADKKVTVVHDHMKKSTVDTPDKDVAVAGGRGQYVLELPAGAAERRHLKAGDQLKLNVAIPAK
jgi:uncharacterized membrane protein (UPF0127 family)